MIRLYDTYFAENKNTMGISTELHQGLAFTEPKIKPIREHRFEEYEELLKGVIKKKAT